MMVLLSFFVLSCGVPNKTNTSDQNRNVNTLRAATNEVATQTSTINNLEDISAIEETFNKILKDMDKKYPIKHVRRSNNDIIGMGNEAISKVKEKINDENRLVFSELIRIIENRQKEIKDKNIEDNFSFSLTYFGFNEATNIRDFFHGYKLSFTNKIVTNEKKYTDDERKRIVDSLKSLLSDYDGEAYEININGVGLLKGKLYEISYKLVTENKKTRININEQLDRIISQLNKMSKEDKNNSEKVYDIVRSSIDGEIYYINAILDI